MSESCLEHLTSMAKWRGCSGRCERSSGTAYCRERSRSGEGLQAHVRFHNKKRLHSVLGYSTPLLYAQERLPQARSYHIS